MLQDVDCYIPTVNNEEHATETKTDNRKIYKNQKLNASVRSNLFFLHSFSFFENISRIIAPNYVPTETDVLRVRLRTCGIIETQFQVNEMTFR